MKADKTVKQDPIALFDEISDRIAKAQGICSLAALPNAMWAARDLMGEAEGFAEKLHKLAAGGAHA